MHPHVRLRTPDGTEHVLGHGDLIGRLAHAALCVDDPRVSEAHAMVSLRDGALRLLALRRLIAVDGRPVSDVELRSGLRFGLADGLHVQVLDVVLPDHLLSVDHPDLGRRALPDVASIRVGPPLTLVSRYEPDAQAWLWSTGDAWRLRVGADDPRQVRAGDTFAVGPHTLTLVRTSLGAAGGEATRLDGAVHAPLRLVASFDTVQVHRDGQPVLLLTGNWARIVSELIALGGPIAWDQLARELWPDERDAHTLRRRWDMVLTRLRARLREAGVRTDLVRAAGGGQVELVLTTGDLVEDRT